jgi:hypothetical protein
VKLHLRAENGTSRAGQDILPSRLLPEATSVALRHALRSTSGACHPPVLLRNVERGVRGGFKRGQGGSCRWKSWENKKGPFQLSIFLCVW